MGRKVVDILGKKFGMITVIRFVGVNKAKGGAQWECRCDCGETRVIRGTALNRGIVRSCGHQQREGLLEKIKRKVKVTESGCWEWMGTRNVYNYGVVHENKKSLRVHRRLYEILHGPIPDGIEVCHRCDNPPCCNPAHLFLGTHKDNMNDCVMKARNFHKLTSEQVVSVYTDYHCNGLGRWKIHKKTGININTIKGIISGRHWRHLTKDIPRTTRKRIRSCGKIF